MRINPHQSPFNLDAAQKVSHASVYTSTDARRENSQCEITCIEPRFVLRTTDKPHVCCIHFQHMCTCVVLYSRCSSFFTLIAFPVMKQQPLLTGNYLDAQTGPIHRLDMQCIYFGTYCHHGRSFRQRQKSRWVFYEEGIERPCLLCRLRRAGLASLLLIAILASLVFLP